MPNCYLALEASRKSGKYVVEGNKQAWLDLFADDAIVQDPVGVSPLDPTGLGHQGKGAIEAFWNILLFDFTNFLDGSKFFDEFDSGFWANSANTWVEICSNHYC